jgi:hypothetical protein
LRRVFLARLVSSFALLTVLGGCSLLRLNEGREFATYSAAYAGRFHIAYGRWPANVNELEEFICMPGRADHFGLAQISCDDLVRKPYRMQLAPRGVDLRMEFQDAAKKSVCALTVFAPMARKDVEVFPMIVIRTSVFSCPGDDGKWGAYGSRAADIS